jgi:hypothetical protein
MQSEGEKWEDILKQVFKSETMRDDDNEHYGSTAPLVGHGLLIIEASR